MEPLNTFSDLVLLAQEDPDWEAIRSLGKYMLGFFTLMVIVLIPFWILGWISQGYYAIRRRFRKWRRESKNAAEIRGRTLIDFKTATQIADGLRSLDDPGMFWGGIRLPSNAAGYHFCVVGSTGSGKTLTLQCLMNSVLRSIGTGRGHRAIIYDAKRDVISVLSGMGFGQPGGPPLMILNPFDARSAAWDISRDVTDKKTAVHVAHILIPPDKNASQPFFSDAVRDLLTGTLVALHYQAPENWSLRDVFLILQSPTRMRQLFQACPHTTHLIESYLAASEWPSIRSTIATKVAVFEPVVAAWEKAPCRISLRDWVRGEGILVLGIDETARTSLDAINRVMFKRMTELLLAEPESESRRTWIFLDECQIAGELDGLSSLLLKGRGYGISVVLGFQDVEGLREVYGEKEANQIVGQCANKAILRLESDKTAEWASAVVGQYEAIETTVSHSYHEEVVSYGQHKTVRQAFIPSQFMNLSTPDRQRDIGLHGIYIVRAVGVFEAKVSSTTLSSFLPKPNQQRLNYVERPSEDQYFSPWSDEDSRRLRLSETSPSSSSSTSPDGMTNDLGRMSNKKTLAPRGKLDDVSRVKLE